MPSLKSYLRQFGRSASGQAFENTNTGINITPTGISGERWTVTYVAPCDGYANVTPADGSYNVNLYIGAFNTGVSSVNKAVSWCGLYVPVAKGQTVVITGDNKNGIIPTVWFFKTLGAS